MDERQGKHGRPSRIETDARQPVEYANAWAESSHTDARHGLEYIVSELNSDSGWGKELRSIVQLWQESGPNLAKLARQNPGLWGDLLTVFHPSLQLTTTGQAHLRLLENAVTPGELKRLGQDRYRAVVVFNALILNPLWTRLAGPCARCGNYYIKKRASQKVYCSRRCGNAATAVERTRERIANERKVKINRATAAIKKWKPANRLDWKHWVTQKTGIDPRFLTRAVTKGDLVPPKQEK